VMLVAQAGAAAKPNASPRGIKPVRTIATIFYP
jgi:hypothetical protein